MPFSHYTPIWIRDSWQHVVIDYEDEEIDELGRCGHLEVWEMRIDWELALAIE